MRTLLVSHREVTGLLPMHDCIDAMTDAFRALATGDAQLPLRQVVSLPAHRISWHSCRDNSA
jgi:ornithine cyclodeaminase/alanine dehydrogenase-like protein (mu-crystallin family)